MGGLYPLLHACTAARFVCIARVLPIAMRLSRSIRACTARCTLLHARTHVLRGGQYLQVSWQIITKHQSGWLAQMLFQVSEIAAILGAPHPSRYGRAV